MKALRILSLLLIAGVLFSCEKDVKEEQKQDVVFGINEIDPTLLKNDGEEWNWNCTNFNPVKAIIELNNSPLLTFDPQVFFVGGKLYTQSIKLAPGKYNITKFLLLDAGGDIIMATPMAESIYAVYVENPLAFEIEVEPFRKAEIEIDVLCFEKAVYENFGFFWFYITEIVIREFCFFGDICATGEPFLPSDFEGSLYEEIGLLLMDMKAIFKIEAFVNYPGLVEPLELPYSPFYNTIVIEEDDPVEFIAPLCVQYPDRIRVNGEVFTFKLYILIPDGNGGFEYQYFHTFEATDHGPLSTSPGTNGVVEFVLGECWSEETPPNIWFSWPVDED